MVKDKGFGKRVTPTQFLASKEPVSATDNENEQCAQRQYDEMSKVSNKSVSTSPIIPSRIAKVIQWQVAEDTSTVSTDQEQRYCRRLSSGDRRLEILGSDGRIHYLKPFEKKTKRNEWKRSKCNQHIQSGLCRKNTFYYCSTCHELNGKINAMCRECAVFHV